MTYLVSAWALFDDLKGIEWLTLMILPSFFAASMALFNFLLPEHPVTRMVVLTIYGMGLYAIYLTENIFSVAAVRTIQLVRAAHAVGFLMTITTIVLLVNTIYSLHFPFWANMLLVSGISLPLFLQGLWSVVLSKSLTKEVVWMSVGMSLLMGQVAGMLSFLPVTVWIASLFLGTVAYVSLGLLQHALNERLFLRTVYEYVGVGVFVLLATLVVTPWR